MGTERSGTEDFSGAASPQPPAERVRCTPLADVVGVSGDHRWLVDSLWGAGAVGLVGGTPKTGKTWLALELAVAVASGRAALGRFEVPNPGPVLLFPAEDDPRAIRDRAEGIARAKGASLDGLFLIEANTLRLDEEPDRAALRALVERIQPRLIVLDPLVRLHGGDENHLGHVVELLSFLRALQREHGSAVLLTHHIAKRRAAKGASLGQALRGSGELHAWGDSNLYLSRVEGGAIRVDVEHRAARAIDPLHVALREVEGRTHLELVDVGAADDAEPSPAAATGRRGVILPMPRPRSTAARDERPLTERVLGLLAASTEPVSQSSLRDTLRVRNKHLTVALHELAVARLITRPGGKRRWQLLPRDEGSAVSLDV